jgi:hypothetical protein
MIQFLTKKICFFILFYILISSCSGIRYYTPEVMPTPMFTEKSQVYSDFSMNTMGGVDYSFGYSLLNNLALMGSVGLSNESNSLIVLRTDPSLSSSNMHYSLSMGYFRNEIKGHKHNFETFLNFKKGAYSVAKSSRVNFNLPYGNNEILSGNYNRWSLQNNIGTDNPFRAVNCVYSIRIGMTQYNTPSHSNQYFSYNSFELNRMQLFRTLEQSFTLLSDRKKLKFKFQLQYGFCPDSNSENDAIKRHSLNFHIGILYIPRKHKVRTYYELKR